MLQCNLRISKFCLSAKFLKSFSFAYKQLYKLIVLCMAKIFSGSIFFPVEIKNDPSRLISGGITPNKKNHRERICVSMYERIETQALNSQGKKQEQIRAFSSEIIASLFYKHFDITSHFHSTGKLEINVLRRQPIEHAH